MTAWPGAHAGIGVDRAAPDSTPVGDGAVGCEQADGHAGFEGRPRLLEASAIHARAFDRSRLTSFLLLAAGGRLVTGNGSVCSITRVPSRRVGWLCLVGLGGLAVVSGMILSAQPTGLSPLGRALGTGAGLAVALWAMVASARGFIDSRLRVEGPGEMALERAGPAPDVPRRSDVWLVAPSAIAVVVMLFAGHRVFVVSSVAAALVALTAAAFAVVACDGADVGAGSAAWAVLAAASPLLLLHLLDPNALGFGDVKFGAVTGLVVAAVGWQVAVLVPLIALLVAAVRRSQGPRAFGPTLVTSTSVVLVVAVALSAWEVIT